MIKSRDRHQEEVTTKLAKLAKLHHSSLSFAAEV
jgi:hypothetical protein